MDYSTAKSRHGLANHLLACAEDSEIKLFLGDKTIKIQAWPEQLKAWNTVLFYHRYEVMALLEVRQMLEGLEKARLV